MDPLTKKTIVFLIVDIIWMFIFAWFWFKYVHPNTGSVDPANESFRYTFWMTTWFAVYYYTFERLWVAYVEPIPQKID